MRRPFFHFLVIGGAMALSGLITTAQRPAFAPVTDEVLRNPPPGDWLGWRRPC